MTKFDTKHSIKKKHTHTHAESTEKRKTSFPKEKNRQKMQTYLKPFKNNNDHTRIMRKVRFRSS